MARKNEPKRTIHELHPADSPEKVEGRFVVGAGDPAPLPITARQEGGGKWRDDHSVLAFDSEAQAEEAAERARETFPDAHVIDTK